MHRTARHALLSAITSLLFTTQAVAQEIEGDIPADLARALLGENQPFEIRFFAGLPEQFPEIELPADSELLGSVDMVNSQRVVLQVAGDGIAQRTQLIRELEALGYLMITRPNLVPPQQRGFVVQMPIPPGMPIQLCSNDLGMLSLRIGNMGAIVMSSSGPATWSGRAVYTPFLSATPVGRFVTNASPTPTTDSLIYITQTNTPSRPSAAATGGLSCEQYQAQIQASGAAGGFPSINIQEHMPRIELPDEATTLGGTGQSMGGFGGSGYTTESRTQVNLDWELGALLDHLAAQIDEQGWQRDHRAAGDVAGSVVWTREVDELDLVGTLRILRLDSEEFELGFSIQSMPTQE
ncbi:MAG: hypothetical protein CMQ46_10695 [Gammaproteobacteria bacterium]|nr:hypothetical protein [Gammaproteobacteria bacterium]MBJ55715.1 hypothetical protein [Gammaproteobacteria bacterium]HBN14320.1 hypothetical protein [Pseudohongiella sp.]|tara:strand:+ start:521 stop:1573 length:1053 start_codon:yes stop_codon:yes gene_type:complete